MNTFAKVFGTPVKNEQGVVLSYENGILHTLHECDIPTNIIMMAIAYADCDDYLSPSDYPELTNLIAWARTNGSPDSIVYWLNEWEGSCGCHFDYDFANLIQERLNKYLSA